MTAQTQTEQLTRATRPFAAFEWMLAGRYLRSRRKETFISVIAGFSFLGITLGVATLIIVMAVMNGFRAELLTKILGINGHVLLQPIDSRLDDFDAVTGRLEGLDGVRFAMPFVEGQAMVSGPAADLGALFRGVRKSDLDKLPLVSQNIKAGTLEGFDEGQGIAIGTRLARSLGVSVGDPIRVITPRGAITPMGMTPRVKAYPVVALFEIGMSEYDGTIAFMPFEEAQLYFNLEGVATGVEVYADDPDNVGAVRKAVEEGAGRPSFVTDWRQRNMTFFSALEVERNVMFLILTLIVLVAALNIISGMTMLVKDKGRDIAVLRTMGATRGAVMRVFVITGASIGTFGTIAGVALGTVVCWNIESIRQGISWLTRTELFSPELYFLSKLPAEMDSTETLAVVAMALGLSFLATIYPAWRAARLDPVEALRYE
ncbi:lipoprotein-releasing ABC transporter permease subunit [Pseudovibrio sp. SPO723]|uniref:lipoprotein-releasing ABC transporter permease subunit n=1 Tax=Nesiotobacter zosterae TaxID=392721 RepID=UPI0029C33DEC|nr:lipoprotein-releasing ABC transporter permease subunit [Pseudovibrio sp. SPO723]MDX5592724.1 lipoprotein-releasing ABC transporter permease subunit [Pseudovibrio sp. SPO723]